jgi:hypothetical protein
MIDTTFILAGKATFTVDNGKGEHFTYKVVAKQDRYKKDRKVYFVNLLTGCDNETSYSYMGMLNPKTLSLALTKGSKVGPNAKSLKVFRWALRVVSGRSELPADYGINHAGHCGRCNRLLTEPESIKIGIGPHCAKLMGI